jgi:uncharacterized protein (DUF697 family)
MEAKSRQMTNVYSGVTAVTAFVTQPVPGLDELVVVPIHYWFALRLARLRGMPARKLPWRSIQRIIWYGAAGRLVTNMSVGLVPVLGAFVNSITAVALTKFLARWLDELMKHPNVRPPEVTMADLKALFATALKRSGPKVSTSSASDPRTT